MDSRNFLLGLAALTGCSGSSGSGNAPPTDTDTPPPTDTDTPPPTDTDTPPPSATDTATATPDPTATPAETGTATETATDAPTATPTATETATPEPTRTPTATPTAASTETPVVGVIEYDGEWQGSISVAQADGSSESRSIAGSGAWQEAFGSPTTVALNAQKQDDSEATLRVALRRGGEVLTEATTTAPYGLAQVSESFF